MIDTKELVMYLKIHRNTLTKLIKDGLPCYKVGSEYRFEIEEVKDWLKINEISKTDENIDSITDEK